MPDRVYEGIHPCAFCVIKYISLCDGCSEFFQSAFMEEDCSVEFLLHRDMSFTEFSGITPAAN